MWRFRPTFVDVVWFECRRPNCFRLEFACGIRTFLPNNPAPWNCPFRIEPLSSLGWDVVDWHFCESEMEQVAVLENLTPRVVTAAAAWFAHFTTIQSAICALESNAGPQRVAPCSHGSPAYEEAMAQLRAVASE
jgi:hypothetical protein